MNGAALKASFLDMPDIGMILAISRMRWKNKTVNESKNRCILCFLHVVFKRFDPRESWPLRDLPLRDLYLWEAFTMETWHWKTSCWDSFWRSLWTQPCKMECPWMYLQRVWMTQSPVFLYLFPRFFLYQWLVENHSNLSSKLFHSTGKGFLSR